MILAGIRCGTFGILPSLRECRASPKLSRTWGCEQPSQMSVKGKDGELFLDASCCSMIHRGVTHKLYHHPTLMIPKSIKAWGREIEYSGLENYSAVPILDRHPCGIEALSVYKRALEDFRSK